MNRQRTHAQFAGPCALFLAQPFLLSCLHDPSFRSISWASLSRASLKVEPIRDLRPARTVFIVPRALFDVVLFDPLLSPLRVIFTLRGMVAPFKKSFYKLMAKETISRNEKQQRWEIPSISRVVRACIVKAEGARLIVLKGGDTPW